MKKKIVAVLVLILVLLIGFVLGAYFVNFRARYDDKKTLNTLYLYIPLVGSIDFKYMKIKGDTIYYTSDGSLSLLSDYIAGDRKSKNIGQIHIPSDVKEKTRGVSIWSIRKIDGQIYFILGGFLDLEVGVFYSNDRNPKLQSSYVRETRRLYSFKGDGYWYYFSTK